MRRAIAARSPKDIIIVNKDIFSILDRLNSEFTRTKNTKLGEINASISSYEEDLKQEREKIRKMSAEEKAKYNSTVIADAEKNLEPLKTEKNTLEDDVKRWELLLNQLAKKI